MESKSKQFKEIINYLEGLENTQDAEFLRFVIPYTIMACINTPKGVIPDLVYELLGNDFMKN